MNRMDILITILLVLLISGAGFFWGWCIGIEHGAVWVTNGIMECELIEQVSANKESVKTWECLAVNK